MKYLKKPGIDWSVEEDVRDLRHAALKSFGDVETVAYIFPAEARKTLPQLGYYWGVILEDIAGQTGLWPDEVHNQNKIMFGVRETILYTPDHKAYECVVGLSKMGKSRASEFIDRVIAHWVAKGVYIREPNELTDDEVMMAHIRDTNDESLILTQ